LALDESKKENDVLVEMDGSKVVYDENLEPYLKYATVDYSSKWYEKGFVIRGLRGGSC